jgi:hypothetical protein
MTTRSAGRAISRYETKPSSEHAAMRGSHPERRVFIVERRDEPTDNSTCRHLDAAGRGAGGACNLRQGLHRPLHRIRRDQAEGEGAQDRRALCGRSGPRTGHG